MFAVARTRCFFSFAAVVWVATAVGVADEPAKVTPAEHVRATLDQKTSLDAKGMTVEKLAETLTQKYGLQFDLDWEPLGEYDVTKETQISTAFKDVPLGRGLERILDPHFAGYYVDDEVIVITSEEKASNTLDTRIYDVADLAPETPGHPTAEDHAEWLVKLVQSTAASMWDDAGGAGSIRWARGVLVVRQSESLHHRVADLLAAVRNVRDRQNAGDERPRTLDGKPLEERWKLLDRRCDFDFQAQPLGKVVESLQKSCGVTITIDHDGLKELGHSVDTPVTARFKNVPLRTGLKRMLATIDLDCHLRDENVLWITTGDKTSGGVETVFYPIRGLVKGKQADLVRFDREPQGTLEIMHTIRKCIDPVMWEDAGGQGTIVSVHEWDMLICTQPEEVHKHIDEFLTKMRAIHAAQQKRDEKAAAESGDEVTTVFYPIVGRDAQAPPEGYSKDVADVVRKVVAADSWKDEKAGPWIGVLRHGLVVRQTRAVHRDVASTLFKLGVLDMSAFNGCFPEAGAGAGF